MKGQAHILVCTVGTMHAQFRPLCSILSTDQTFTEGGYSANPLQGNHAYCTAVQFK